MGNIESKRAQSRKTSVDTKLRSSSPASSNSPITPVDGEALPGASVTQPNDTKFILQSKSIDEPRPYKVVVIGAGFSGIMCGIRFPQRMTNLDLTIYEKNTGIGGTWFVSRYPGCACDVPAHSYQLSFENKSDWSSFYAPAPEIRAELEHIVDKYDLMKYIRLQHEVLDTTFDETTGKWNLRIRRPRRVSVSEESTKIDVEVEYEEFTDNADLVVIGAGCLSRWEWPDIPGLKSFKGKLVHTAGWDTSDAPGGWWHDSVKDWSDKNVGVIGAGSSTTQAVPALQPKVGHLYNYVRGKTWLAPSFLSDEMSKFYGIKPTNDNHVFTEEEKELLKDPKVALEYRKALDHGMNSSHLMTIKGTPMQLEAQELFKKHMKSKLTKKPWIADYLMPDFGVTCRRLTPGPGYLEALQADNTDFIPTHIKRVTETGIDLVDGTHHDLDVIVCATGYDTSFKYPFAVKGRKGQLLNDRFTPHPETYISLAADGFPNLFMMCGPNSVIGTGSLLSIMEKQADYIVEVGKKMQREGLKSIEPKKEAIKEWDQYMEAYFETTTFSESCSSWYKLGKSDGRIVGLWPGSCLHAIRTFEYPRWEDYNFQQLDPPCSEKGQKAMRNRWYWLGDGATYNEKTMTGDRSWYLNPGYLDTPPVPTKCTNAI